MKREALPEPPLPEDDTDADFDAWSLDEFGELADVHAPRTMAAHDAYD